MALPAAAWTREGFSPPSLNDGLTALGALLRESEQSAADFAQLMALAYQRGHREGHAGEVNIRRTVLPTVVLAILSVIILVSGLFFLEGQTGKTSLNRIYEKTSPAVANIQVASAGVTGSGVVFDPQGYLLTNYHVIKEAQNDQDILVQLPGHGPVSTKLLGYDIASDLAVLQVDAGGCPA